MPSSYKLSIFLNYQYLKNIGRSKFGLVYPFCQRLTMPPKGINLAFYQPKVVGNGAGRLSSGLPSSQSIFAILRTTTNSSRLQPTVP